MTIKVSTSPTVTINVSTTINNEQKHVCPIFLVTQHSKRQSWKYALHTTNLEELAFLGDAYRIDARYLLIEMLWPTGRDDVAPA